MGSHVPPGLAHHIRNLAGLCRAVSQSDADLLTAFIELGDGESFAALVVRHGQAVWTACRQVLDNDADAEDAFQATFITLARKATTLRREPLDGWLRKVAHDVALNAYKAARRRTAALHRLCESAAPPTGESPPSDEVWATVREELANLPERLRVPLALFYLDGKSQAEVAQLLGVTDRSIRNRLAKGLAALRERLSSRGVVVTTAALVAMLGNVPTLSALPSSLVALATASALAVAVGKPVATPAARLAEEAAGVTRWGRMKLWGLLVIALGVGVGAAAIPSAPAARPNPPAPPVGTSAKSEELRTDQFGDPLPAQSLVRIGTIRLRPGHSSGETAVAISPDNKTIYSVHTHDEVRIWELATGKEVRTLPAPKNVHGVAVSPDGRRLVTAGLGEVWAWDIAAVVPQLLWKQKARGLGYQCVAFAPDGRTVACGGSANTILLLDAITGEVQQTLPGRGYKLAFSPDGKTLASSARDGVVRLWDVAAGKEQRALACVTAQHARVNSFAFSPDSRTLVTATKEGVIAVWDAASGKERRLTDGAHPNAFVAFEADGKAVLEVGGGRIRFRDPATGKECRDAVAVPQLTANILWDSCRLSADGKLFVSASATAIGVWETRTGKAVGPTGVPAGSLMSIAFSPDGQRVALAAMSANGGWDGSAAPQVYDSRTGRLLKEFRFPKSDRSPFVLFRSPVRLTSKHLLISAIRNGEANSSIGYCLTWGDADEPTTQPTEGVKGHWHQFPTPSPDGELLATPQPGNGVVISERVGGKLRHTLNTQSVVTCLAFSSDGGLMAGWEYGQRSATVTIWEVKTGKKLGGWTIDDEPRFESAPPLALSADGQRVAIGTDSRGREGKVRVWDVATGALLWEFTNAVNPATAVAFSPDGRMLATGGDDGVVRLWETFTGQERLKLPGHRARVWSLAFSPDGLRLASASADSTALIWDARSSPRSEPNAKPESLWAALTGADAVVAYRTVHALAESPKTSVPLLRQWLRPTPPKPGQVEKWIAELGSESASVRDAATRELTALAAQGDGVEAAVRKALKDNPSAGAKARLAKLIANFGPASPWKLGAKRGVESLEWMGADPGARKLLKELAVEADGFLRTEARAACGRLAVPLPESR